MNFIVFFTDKPTKLRSESNSLRIAHTFTEKKWCKTRINFYLHFPKNVLYFCLQKQNLFIISLKTQNIEIYTLEGFLFKSYTFRKFPYKNKGNQNFTVSERIVRVFNILFCSLLHKKHTASAAFYFNG